MKWLKRLKQKYYNHRADVLLLSYPKCGRTWLRLMLGQVLEDHFGIRRRAPLQLHKIADRRLGIPCIVALHDWRTGPDVSGDAELELDKSRFSGRRVLLLIRNPCDVVVSNYYQKVFREQKFSGSISEFVRHPVWGIDNVVRYYNIWARDQRLTKHFKLLRYEDLRATPEQQLREVLKFVGVHGVPDDVIAQAVANYSFENMKRREQEGTYSSRGLSAGDARNPASFKARSGKMGGYRAELSVDDRIYVESAVREQLSDMFASYHPEEDA